MFTREQVIFLIFKNLISPMSIISRYLGCGELRLSQKLILVGNMYYLNSTIQVGRMIRFLSKKRLQMGE